MPRKKEWGLKTEIDSYFDPIKKNVKYAHMNWGPFVMKLKMVVIFTTQVEITNLTP